jgi:hypothetical protein
LAPPHNRHPPKSFYNDVARHSITHRQLGANDGADAEAGAGGLEAHDAGERHVVGEAERWHAKLGGPGDERLDRAARAQEAEGAAAMQLRVCARALVLALVLVLAGTGMVTVVVMWVMGLGAWGMSRSTPNSRRSAVTR